MQTPPIYSPIGYDLLIFLAVCVLAVAFMIWFLIGLILDTRRAQRLRLSWYESQSRCLVYNSADDDFSKESEYAGHSVDSVDHRVFRSLDRLRPL